MKNLILIRHGKSSWKYDVPDEMRPLKSRGKMDGALIGKELKSYQLSIDAIFSSPANRAFSTCKLICEALEYPLEKVTKEEELYDFGGQRVLRFIKNLSDNLNTVLLFGHNHAFTALANTLGNQHIANVPTTGVVWLQFSEEKWSEISQGITKNSIFPKELK
ncbi:phosphohistidine phosphatase [Pustulibacterium marinum]|uniref:Phosphohistidine phosphatase n=1 Tax=Pustulibacterium marinum TaxID=1224947 RepID=A0A1I7G2S8_9FLAO|nr:histidine phosphatase family protein [Pustulibacterium marinum]SFU42764.1 phosphohistidine phosphatase [Pustulibacterium marinum]